MRHVRLFEAHGANYRRTQLKNHLDARGRLKLLDITVGTIDRISAMIEESLGLARTWYGLDNELQSAQLVYWEKVYDNWDTRLFVSVGSLEDDYWLLSIVVVIDSTEKASWPSERVVDMHLTCDDMRGLGMAIQGPLAQIIGRMNKIDAEYKALRSSVHGLGDGIQTEG